MGGPIDVNELESAGVLIAQTNQAGLNQIFQEDIGRSLSDAEFAQLSDSVVFTLEAGKSVVNIEKTKIKLFNTQGYKDIIKTEIKNRITTELKDQLGITDPERIDQIIDNFDELDLLLAAGNAGTGGKRALKLVSKSITTIDNQRQTAIELLYAGEYGKILEGDNTNLQKDMDAYMESIAGSDFGLDLLMEGDRTANRKIAAQMSSDINANISGNESIQETRDIRAAETEADKPFGMEEVETKLNEARDRLADELAGAEGNRTEALRAAFKTFTDKIPDEIAKVREIAEERLTERLEKLPETFGEFGARLGLGVGQSGQLQQALAEEAVKATAETERGLAEFQIGREREAAGIGLNLEQNIADFRAQQEQRVAGLGFDIAQIGTQIGREDFTRLLQQRFAQAQQTNQQEYQTFLTQMGYTQNRIAQQEAFNQQQSMLFQQQGFQSAQSVLDRELQERLFNRSADLAEEQRQRQRKSQRSGAIQSLVGTAAGVGLGLATGGLGFGLTGSKLFSAGMLGGGLLGGQQGLTQAGSFGFFI